MEWRGLKEQGAVASGNKRGLGCEDRYAGTQAQQVVSLLFSKLCTVEVV